MKGYVYKIANANDSIIYIGSTTETLTKRWEKHVLNYRCWLKSGGSACAIFHSFQEHGINSFDIHLISEHDISHQRQLHQAEQLVIDKTKGAINRQRSFRTPTQLQEYQRQYRTDNRDAIRVNRQEYYKQNRESIIASRKVSYDCDCGGRYQTTDRSKHMRTQKHQRWVQQQA
jgi:hypothetical protein